VISQWLTAKVFQHLSDDVVCLWSFFTILAVLRWSISSAFLSLHSGTVFNYRSNEAKVCEVSWSILQILSKESKNAVWEVVDVQQKQPRPCGTPDSTRTCTDDSPSTTMFLWERWEPVMNIAANSIVMELHRSLLWGTVSNALLKSKTAMSNCTFTCQWCIMSCSVVMRNCENDNI